MDLWMLQQNVLTYNGVQKCFWDDAVISSAEPCLLLLQCHQMDEKSEAFNKQYISTSRVQRIQRNICTVDVEIYCLWDILLPFDY